jgi:hypothetical protein
VDHQVAIQGAVWRQLLGIEALHLLDGGAMERQLMVDVVASAVRQAVVVIVDAEVGRLLRIHLEQVAEPSADGPVEPRLGVGDGLLHVWGSWSVRRSRRSGLPAAGHAARGWTNGRVWRRPASGAERVSEEA